jgi:hypothetical protein
MKSMRLLRSYDGIRRGHYHSPKTSSRPGLRREILGDKMQAG